jgi:RNA polymerase sigma factor (sigma-70 family)
VYGDSREFLQRIPEGGIVLVFDDHGTDGAVRLLHSLSEQRVWLPVVATSFDPSTPAIVAAMKAGALDYLQLPLEEQRFLATIHSIALQAEVMTEAQHKIIRARDRIASLSPREREVLDRLSDGCSNKTIAQELEISPRTVEVHRANMMDKLGADHSAQAVRLHIEASLDRLAG